MGVVTEQPRKLDTLVVPCPLCKSERFQTIAVARTHWLELDRNYSIVQCEGCGCKYLNPRLTDKSLSDAYSIVQSRGSTKTDTPIPKGNVLVRWWRHYSSYQVADAITDGPVLDLGCNQGELMEELREKGLKVSGVEFSSPAVAKCKRLGLDVREARLEDFMIPNGQFKTVVLSHVLENLVDPVQVLARIAESLGEDGSVVICVPNVDSPIRRLFGPHWHGWDPPFHLVHYDEDSLCQVCELAGLPETHVVKRMLPEDVRRSLLLWRGNHGRYLLLRAMTVPVLMFLTWLGFGSYLLVTARPRPEE